MDVTNDVVDVVAAVFLMQADELVEVPLAPVGKTLKTNGNNLDAFIQ